MTYEERLRRKLAQDLRKSGSIQSDRVAEAFAAMPRHMFVPDKPLKQVYSDLAFPKLRPDGVAITSSSQPSIMAIMLEQLDVLPGHRVLEIGAGTGYNAALLAHLVGWRGRVTAIDIDANVARDARSHLRATGARVRVITGDGGFGHAKDAPYDRIIATASCWQIPEAWVDQLVDGGVLVLPFRLNGAHIVIALRREGDVLVSTRASVGGFMPMRGAFGPAGTAARFENVRIMADYELSERDSSLLATLLADSKTASVRYPPFRDARNTPLHYLVLQGKPVVIMDGGSQQLPPFGLIASRRSAVGFPWFRPERGRVRVFGSNEALDLLREALTRWKADGRPDARDLRMSVRPSTARLGTLPRRYGERWRFRRGAHAYEVRFERT